MTDLRDKWCPVCCTRHDSGPRCPGELLATGPERFGWRVAVTNSDGRTEEFAVLVAPAGDLWRGRLLTLPNMLWCVPGARATMKFVGNSAQQVEGRARRYVQRFCASRELTCSSPSAAAAAGGFKKEAGAGPGGGASDERLLHSIRVRFGEQRAVYDGRTANLSNGGLFVITDQPLPKGRKIKLTVHMPDAVLPLRGVVAWSRAKAEDGREAGMGVQLIAPPALYRHYVARVAAEQEVEGAAADSAPARPAASA